MRKIIIYTLTLLFQTRAKITLPVDKGLTEYMSWWENILGLAEEPELPLIPVDVKVCPSCGNIV